MIHPIPSGTRDVLPEETREVRAITDTLLRVFERHRYGEVYTPALEYESVLTRADMADAEPAYRVFDETGAVLAGRARRPSPHGPVRRSRRAAARRAPAPRRPRGAHRPPRARRRARHRHAPRLRAAGARRRRTRDLRPRSRAQHRLLHGRRL